MSCDTASHKCLKNDEGLIPGGTDGCPPCSQAKNYHENLQRRSPMKAAFCWRLSLVKIDIFYRRAGGPAHAGTYESLDGLGSARGKRFHRAIGAIANPAVQSELASLFDRKVPITHRLHKTLYDQSKARQIIVLGQT